MIPKQINNISKNKYVLYAFTIYAIMMLYKLNRERKYNRIILFCVSGLITAYFSKNILLSLVLAICAVCAFNYYRSTYEPFIDKLDDMDAMLTELESIMNTNQQEGGKDLLNMMSETDKNISSDDFKKKIFTLLDGGTQSKAKDDLRVKYQSYLQDKMENINESLDKMKKIGDNGKWK